MKIYKYRIFNPMTKLYLSNTFYSLEQLAEYLSFWNVQNSSLEIHKIQIGKVDLVIED